MKGVAEGHAVGLYPKEQEDVSWAECGGRNSNRAHASGRRDRHRVVWQAVARSRWISALDLDRAGLV